MTWQSILFSQTILSQKLVISDCCFSSRKEITSYLLGSQHLFQLHLEIHTQHPITTPTDLPDLLVALGTTRVSSNLVLQRPCRNRVGGEMCGRKERRVETKERELKDSHVLSILVVDVADYTQYQFFFLQDMDGEVSQVSSGVRAQIKASCLRLQAGGSKTRTNSFALKKIQ